jgi:LacI family transcriptional regulator
MGNDPKAVSIRDVAKKSSLSCETILEVLISPSAIEPEVVRFVMKTIRETGYLETFSRWKTGKTSSAIAVLTTMFDSPSGAEVFRGIDRAMSALGLNLSMLGIPTRGSSVFREEIFQTLIPFNMVDGVIAINSPPAHETAEKYARVGKPLIVLEDTVTGAQSVLLENQKGMAIAINYLYGRGHRRIALINGPTEGRRPETVASARLIGYLTSMHRLGLKFDESLVYEAANYDAEAGRSGFAQFKRNGPMPDAVVCAAGDMSAFAFIKAAREEGLRVPEDIAVMGYDDLPVASLMSPALTTIRQRLMIAGAASLVLALEAAVNGMGENLVIMPELVVRDTA